MNPNYHPHQLLNCQFSCNGVRVNKFDNSFFCIATGNASVADSYHEYDCHLVAATVEGFAAAPAARLMIFFVSFF